MWPRGSRESGPSRISPKVWRPFVPWIGQALAVSAKKDPVKLDLRIRLQKKPSFCPNRSIQKTQQPLA